jgi:hypothetical protein
LSMPKAQHQNNHILVIFTTNVKFVVFMQQQDPKALFNRPLIYSH